MKTIPASWKPGGTTDRNLWYNTIGTPITLIRIQSATQTIRMGTERIRFHDGEGWTEYDDRFFNTISSIEFSLTFLEGKAGAIGQMGQCEIDCCNNAQDGNVMNEMYDMDDFIGAEVTVWYLPKEIGSANYTTANASQDYNGVIVDIKEQPNKILFVVNEKSNIKHKKIPMRLNEFNGEHSLSWTVPQGNVAKVVPICFGEGIFKAYHCNTIEGTPRYYYLCYHYKDIRASRNLKLYYYEQEKKKFTMVPYTQFSEIGYLGNTLYLARFNVEDLAIYEEMVNYLSPNDADYMTIGGYPAFAYVAKIHDKAKTLLTDAGETNREVYTMGSYVTGVLAYFNKSQFNQRGNFDLYVLGDFSHNKNGNFVRWEVKMTWLTYSCELLQAKWDYDAGSDHYYCALIPTTWGDESLFAVFPNEPISSGLLKKNVSPEDLTDIVNIALSFKSLYNPWTTEECYCHELVLMQLMHTLPRDFYVADDFDNSAIQTALSYIFTNFLNIASTDIVYENFIEDYYLDGQVCIEYGSYELLGKIAEDFGLIFYEDEAGKERFIDIAPDDTVYEITDADIVRENSLLKIEKYRTDTDVYSAFFVDYQKNYASDEYEASKYVTKDNHNLGHIDAVTMQVLCQDAYDNYNTEKRLSMQLDLVRDNETAELILGKLVQFYSRKRLVIKITTTDRLRDLELGDQVTINTTFFNSDQNFYIASKIYNPDHSIDFLLFESPWDGAGKIRTLSELEGINESYMLIKVQICDETEGINETVIHVDT